MPPKYFVEMVMDRIAACKIYNGKNYSQGDALHYLINSAEGKDLTMMHPKTREDLVSVLTMLEEKGEAETFRYLRKEYLKRK